MELHKHKEIFKEVIETVATDIGLLPFQIEKDYYVSVMLKEIAQTNEVMIVFKGGTSLSKCYDIIDRFSEDIDLAVYFEGNKLNDKKRKKLKKALKGAIAKLDFNFLNENKVESNKDYNKYEVGYQKLFGSDPTMVDHIIVETIVVYKPYPCEEHKVSNYITKYLERNRQTDIIKTYGLEPFDMMIQTINRTFIDKVFATCDYHLQKEYLRHSRHIYDLHKIWNSGLLNIRVVKEIIEDVIRDRQLYGTHNLSCMPNQMPNDILKNIYEEHVYQDDYNNITSAFVYKPVTYETVAGSIKEISESRLIPGMIKNHKMR